MSEIQELLQSIGYTLINEGSSHWRAKPLYRDSGNNTSLRINKENGRFVDFSANISGDFKKLIALTMNLSSMEEAEKWLSENKYNTNQRIVTKPIISNSMKIYDESILSNLIKDHSYWEAREISSKTLSQFKGGVAISGAMEGRYVFPIYDRQNRLIGFSGRDVTNKKRSKYKHYGPVKNWLWPGNLNREIVEEKREIILVESAACVLKLWDCGIKNSICLFGTRVSDSILSFLAGLQLDRIIISLNRDGDSNGKVGEIACQKAMNKLKTFFNENKVQIILPIRKDFAESSSEEILMWKEENNIK